MNKYILLVKKWLDDPASVTQQELVDNAVAAAAAAYAACPDPVHGAVDAASTYAAHSDAYALGAGYWVRRYEELTK